MLTLPQLKELHTFTSNLVKKKWKIKQTATVAGKKVLYVFGLDNFIKDCNAPCAYVNECSPVLKKDKKFFQELEDGFGLDLSDGCFVNDLSWEIDNEIELQFPEYFGLHFSDKRYIADCFFYNGKLRSWLDFQKVYDPNNKPVVAKVRVSNQYEATITKGKEYVDVGCQRISIKAIEEVLKQVKEINA